MTNDLIEELKGIKHALIDIMEEIRRIRVNDFNEDDEPKAEELKKKNSFKNYYKMKGWGRNYSYDLDDIKSKESLE